MTPKQFCKAYLENYTINSDNTIDVNGYVELYKNLGDMEKLPVIFEKVSGSFSCYGNNLTTLEGCPKYVGGNFNCRLNNLTSLQCCPKYIGSRFYCSNLSHHVLGNVQGNIFYKKQRIVI